MSPETAGVHRSRPAALMRRQAAVELSDRQSSKK
jgi:hypothetical protein